MVTLQKLLYLRPCELNTFITKIKILKKYNRLKENDVKKFESVFIQLFQDTPYPFTWKLWYEGQNSYTYLHVEKKVLFEHFYL
jgi:hypothetical protein